MNINSEKNIILLIDDNQTNIGVYIRIFTTENATVCCEIQALH